MSRKKKSPEGTTTSTKKGAGRKVKEQDSEEVPTTTPASTSAETTTTTENAESAGASTAVVQETSPERKLREFVLSVTSEGLRAFRKAIITLGLMTEEATFHMSKEGMRFTSMDPSHVALIDFFWAPRACKAFDTHGEEEEFDFTVRLEDFVRRLPTPSESGMTFEMSQNPEDSHNGRIITRKSLGGRSTTTELKELQNSSSKKTPLPKVPTSVRAILNAGLLLEILNTDFATIGNFIRLTAQHDTSLLEISTRGDTGKASTTFQKGSAEMISLDISASATSDITAAYSLEYILSVLKKLKADNITLEFGDTSPLRMRYCLPNDSYIDFLLAPRVNDKEATVKKQEEEKKTVAPPKQQPEPPSSNEVDEGSTP